MVTKEKKKEVLRPEIVESESSMDPIDMKLLVDNIDSSTILTESSDSESLFKAVVHAMGDRKNISMKTEYLSVKENYNGVKLEFLSDMGNMPYLKKFVEIFETKRVSYLRKGRKEDVMILQRREEEIQRQQQHNLNKMFNVN